MRSLSALALLVSLALVVAAADAQTEYNLIPLPDISSGRPPIAIDVNDHGQVLCKVLGEGLTYIFEDGQYRPLGIPDGMLWFAGLVLTNSGHVVGQASDAQFATHSFLWHETTGFLPDVLPGYIVDMNESLQVIGYRYVGEGQDASARGFIWENGVVEDLGDFLPEFGPVFPTAINDLGQIVGYVQTPGLFPDWRAVLWQEGVLTNLGTLGGTGDTFAYDISNSGSIVGSYCLPTPEWDCFTQALLYRDGVSIDLDPDTDSYSYGLKVNVHDEVIVYRNDDPTLYRWRNGVLDNMATLVNWPPGWYWVHFVDLNDHGDILCEAFDPDLGGVRPCLLSRGGILSPSYGQLLVSRTEDAIRWQVPEDMGYLYIELNTHAEDEPDRYVPVGDAPPQVGQFFWTVPDSISTQCRLRIFSPGHPDTLYSGLFRMKPLMLTTLDEDGDYVPWAMGRDNWSQRNLESAWWPDDWWVGNPDFDYEDGIDPISGMEYPDFPWPSAFAFDTAEPSAFPDWPLFVQTFGQTQTYDDVVAGTYNPTALWNWFCQRDPWEGSCSGMAYSSLMNFRDPQAMRDRFPALAAYETLPDDPTAADDIRLMVNQLQGVQAGAEQAALARERLETMTPRDIVRILEEEFAQDEPLRVAPLGLYNDELGGAHAVVPFNLTALHAGADSMWNIETYDPNLGDEPSFVRVRKRPGESQWSWSATINDRIWRGAGTGLMLDLPADLDYGVSVPLLPVFNDGGGGGAKAETGRAREVWSNDFTVFTSARGSLALTASDRPGTAGHVDGQPVNDLPGVTPLYRRTSVIGPPRSYLIDGGFFQPTYTFAMGVGDDAERVLGVFRGDASVCYQRAPGEPTATDLVSFTGAGTQIGVAAAGTPGAPKSIALTTIAQEYDHQKVWLVSEVTLADGDSIRVTREGSQEIRILNAGPAPRTCTLGLQRASALGDQQFMATGVALAAGASLRVVADWSDLAEAPVVLEVDLDDDGIVDDTLEVANELEDPATAVTPEASPTANFRFTAQARDRGQGGVRVQGSLPVDCDLKVQAYDLLGRNLGTIFAGRHDAGDFSLTWTLQDGRGARPASGVYFVRLEATGPDGRVLYRGARKFVVAR